MIGPDWITGAIEKSKADREAREERLKWLEEAYDDAACQGQRLERMATCTNQMRDCVVGDAWNRLGRMLMLIIERKEWVQVVPLLTQAAEFWKRQESYLRELDDKFAAIHEVEK